MLDFNPQLHTRVAFHNDSEAIPVTRANGVTTAAVVPSGGVLGGQVAVMNLDGWTWEESTVRASSGISFQFPSLGDGNPGGDRDYDALKRARDEKLGDLSRLLGQARAYAKAGTGASHQTDWVLDALVPIVDRSLPLFTEVDREADIRAAIDFADREHVRLILTGGQEAGRVASLLKEKNIPVILGPVLRLPSREDASHAASFLVANELLQAGVKFAFATGDSSNARLLPYHAAMAVAWGLPRDEAIKALTINAAELLGVGDRVGSIEPGRHANLLIAKGDPLEIQTEITHVIIAGRDVNLMNKHMALYERYMARQ
jgi:imidazolonepropionase-like amidohydrolase